MVKTTSTARQKIETDINKITGAIRNIPDFPKPGILFRDITPLLGNAGLFKKTIDLLCRPYQDRGIDYAVGVEARGFLLAGAAACRIGCGVVPVRKKGKLPFKTFGATYDLEYGQDTLEIHQDAFSKGGKIIIIDDVLATGGTAKAVAELVEKAGGKVVGISFLIELAALNGRTKIRQYPIHALIKY
ncbi:MAG: adenine phosphoribosyltransferase [Elusimicrobia bacterium]|nr:adenine phosphoribosyltransferase [Elusimicrobiota bacterium]